MITAWKPLTESEYIIWRAETREKLKTDFPTYDTQTINNYLKAVENLVRKKVERSGNKFTDFE